MHRLYQCATTPGSCPTVDVPRQFYYMTELLCCRIGELAQLRKSEDVLCRLLRVPSKVRRRKRNGRSGRTSSVHVPTGQERNRLETHTSGQYPGPGMLFHLVMLYVVDHRMVNRIE